MNPTPILVSMLMTINTLFALNKPELHLFDDPNFTISLEIVNNTTYKYILDDKRTEAISDTTFVVINNDFETFKQAFKNTVTAKKLKDRLKDNAVIESEGNKVYYFFKAVQILGPELNFRPEAGELLVSNKLHVDRVASTDRIVKRISHSQIHKLKPQSNRGRWFLQRRLFRYMNGYYFKSDLSRRLRIDSIILPKIWTTC